MIERVEVHRGRQYQGDPPPKSLRVKVILQVGPESFPIAEDDLTEDTYRTQLVDLLRAAARELEDG